MHAQRLEHEIWSRSMRIELECEGKLRGSFSEDYSDSLTVVERICGALVPVSKRVNEDHYHDTKDWSLADKDLTFRSRRRRALGVRFDYKAPIQVSDDFIVRRKVAQVVESDDDALDLANPFHQRMRFLVDLTPVLSGPDGRISAETLAGFETTVILRTTRTTHICHHLPSGTDWMFWVSIDRVECYRPGIAKPFARFSELEVEVIRAFPLALDVL